MRYIYIVLVFVLPAFVSITLCAQTNVKMKITVVVRDADGRPVHGAAIRSETDNTSAVSDSTGTFTIDATPGTMLSISAPSYETQLISASPDLEQITLSGNSINQRVRVAHRTMDENNLMVGVSHVNMAEILEKNYITSPLDNMEAFVGGFNGNLWGMDEYLLLVDGVPRDVGSVMPTEIDQITFLKGAAALALYGSRAAKGAILITTKRGIEGTRTVNVRANTGIFVPKRYPKYLGSAEYMTLYNEARVNDGLSELYSDEDIYNHASGSNPYRYPDVDYYSPEYLKDFYSRSDATVEIKGGNERTKYYTNIGYWKEGSLLNFGLGKNSKNERVNIRGNVDMKLNHFLTAYVDAAAVYYSGKGVSTDYWSETATLRPNRYTPLIPISMIEESDVESQNFVTNSNHLIDGKYLLGGTQLDQTNPIADIYAGGTSTYSNRQFQFNTGVNADLKGVLKGLSFSSQFGIDYSATYNLAFNSEYATFEPTWNNYAGIDQISSLTKYGQDASSGEQSVSGSQFRQTFSFTGLLNYQNRINDDHNVTAMFVAGGFQQAVSAEYHRTSNANLGLHLGYDYKNKYMVDFNGALVHSAKMPEANRQSFSPTISLGWRISDEDFMASSSVVNDLKLSVSAGYLHTDLDVPGYFLYEVSWDHNGGAWYTWRDGLQNTSADSRRAANPDMKLPRREEISVGLDASLWNNLVTVNASFFRTQMKGIVVQNEALYPSYFETGYPESSFLPWVNYDNDQRTGFDFNVNLNKRMGEVDITLGLSGTYYTTKASKRAEIVEDEYQRRQGKPLDAIWGLEALGFFADQSDIDNSSNQAAIGGSRQELMPGDIKYKDQNGDGLINDQDQIYLGRWNAPLTAGIHLTARWRNFTFFALGVARTGGQAMKSNDYFWVNGEDKYSEVVRGRWTEATQATATYPRLTTQNGSNNFRNSDFWLYSTDRFDLAKVQVSYTFPQTVIPGDFFKQLGVYLNGSNLLTIAPNREILELNFGSAPQTRFFNLGVSAQF